MPSKKKECSGRKSGEESQTRPCLESISFTQPVITSSRQCVTKVPSEGRTSPSRSKTPLQNEVKYCTSDTCRNSSTCIKTLPKYCPYGTKSDSDASVCPGASSQDNGGNQFNAIDYCRQSAMSLAETIAKSFHDSIEFPENTTTKLTDNNIQKAYIKEEMSNSGSENESTSKRTCCPNNRNVAMRRSSDDICPSVKAFLTKQNSQEVVKLNLEATQTEVPKRILKGTETPAKSNQAMNTTSMTSTCPSVNSTLKILSELPCSGQPVQIKDTPAKTRTSFPAMTSLKRSPSNQQSALKTQFQNGTASLPSKKSNLSNEVEKANCCPIKETKESDSMHPCAEENFPCCKSSICKSAISINQEKPSKSLPGCGKPTCTMTLCGPKPPSTPKCTSTGRSPTKTQLPTTKSTMKSSQNAVSSSNCTSKLCPGNERRQCSCRYPPAFSQFSCTGDIAGNCDCCNKNE